MKTTIYILLVLIGLLSCKAQIFAIEGGKPDLIEEGMYLKDTNNNFNKFEGTWQYDDGTIKLTVFLEKIQDYAKAGYFSDRVLGNFIYEENGVEIVNTLTNPSTSQGSHDVYHIDIFSIKDANSISGWIEDPIRSKWTLYALFLTYVEIQSSLNGPPDLQLQWNIMIRDFYNPDGDPDATQELRIPKTLTLNKI